ncbi:uncharacterized protein LOC127123437 [Lathyrus oleraceus]|uniref:uncharacterized protein LOC127123437 n=1 Tax=Pisum sativum TaxID=3888 RepID=UPI0021D2A68C|nr:uncharacterized protein LOC127123437 [Pisum sativum]
MVNRHQDADGLVQRIRRDDMATNNNNLEAMVKRIMAHNGVYVGLYRPNYTSPLSKYVLQSELPSRWKVPKLTMFSGDTSVSTVEHVARYFIEAGEIANNESLRMEYFPSSLKKNAFTFHLLKARCFTQVPEHELVEMDVGDLEYSIRKKLDTQYLKDMAQLADRV